MIRLEVKVVLPENKTKEDFLNYFLEKFAHEPESFFWQASFDLTIMERVSFSAVLGKASFPFLDGEEVLKLCWDFASDKEVQKACSYLENLAIVWDIEISKFPGERIYNDVITMPDIE